LSKHCEFCGRFFIPDPRVGNRQRACSRPECGKARKRASQQTWLAHEPDYFSGRYSYVKEWRLKRRQTAGPMIQDEITLRRVAGSTFAAPGVSRRMIQDTIAPPT